MNLLFFKSLYSFLINFTFSTKFNAVYLLYFKIYVSGLIKNQISNEIIKTYVCSLKTLLWASRGAEKWRHSRPRVFEEGGYPGGYHSSVEFSLYHIHFLAVYQGLCPTDPLKSAQNIDDCFSLAQNPLSGKNLSMSSL